MGKFNEDLANAGVMLAGEGLHPTSKGKRIKFSGDKRKIRKVKWRFAKFLKLKISARSLHRS